MDVDEQLTTELAERGRVVVAEVRAPLRVTALQALVAGFGIAYGDDVRIEGRPGDFFIFTAPADWPDRPPHFPPDEDLDDDRD